MAEMRKHTQNKIIDLISFICMIGLITTGVILYWVIPPGSHGETLWGLTRHQWGDVHFWVAILFVIVMAVHLTLHFSWIKTSYFSAGHKK